MTLLSIGQFDIDGVFRIDADGIAAYINVSLNASFRRRHRPVVRCRRDASSSTSAGCRRRCSRRADGSQVTVKAGLKLNISGTVTFLGFASASGSVTITLQSGVFSVEFGRVDHARAADDRREGRRGDLHRQPPGPSRCCWMSASTPTCSRSSRSRPLGKLQLNTSTATVAHALGHHHAGQQLPDRPERRRELPRGPEIQRELMLEVGYEGIGSWQVRFSAGMDFLRPCHAAGLGHVQLQVLLQTSRWTANWSWAPAASAWSPTSTSAWLSASGRWRPRPASTNSSSPSSSPAARACAPSASISAASASPPR